MFDYDEATIIRYSSCHPPPLRDHLIPSLARSTSSIFYSQAGLAGEHRHVYYRMLLSIGSSHIGELGMQDHWNVLDACFLKLTSVPVWFPVSGMFQTIEEETVLVGGETGQEQL